jgi:hypothetical protein
LTLFSGRTRSVCPGGIGEKPWYTPPNTPKSAGRATNTPPPGSTTCCTARSMRPFKRSVNAPWIDSTRTPPVTVTGPHVAASMAWSARASVEPSLSPVVSRSEAVDVDEIVLRITSSPSTAYAASRVHALDRVVVEAQAELDACARSAR